MKSKQSLILMCFIVFFTISQVRSQCPLMYPRFTELTFYQDSFNPLTIHTTFKAVARLDCDFTQAETSVDWGDSTSGFILVADTVSCIAYNPLQIYYATHTYDTLSSDSIVYFSFTAFPISLSVTNTFSPPSGLMLGTQAYINLNYLKNVRDFHSPVFNGPYFIYDTMFHVLTYDPQVFVDSPYHVHVGIVQPYSFINQQITAITPLNYPSNPSNNYSVDINTGTLIWDTAQNIGGYLFTYLVYTYDTAGTFICANSRNMIINVADTFSQSTGIKSIGGSSANIYPNPATDRLELNYPVQNFTITIINMDGQLIEAPMTNNGIDISGLPSGVYCLRLQSAEGSIVKKFVKE